MKKQVQGVTLPELMMVLIILSLLFSIVSIVLLRGARLGIQGATLDTLLADLRDQQTKAMSQNTGGLNQHTDFGIYLGSDFYTLFRGSAYSANDSNNFVVYLDEGLTFNNVTFASNSVIFDSGSGEVVGYSASANDLSVSDTASGNVINLELNKYGIPLEQ